jgi:osmotically-inducible protein OsmY
MIENTSQTVGTKPVVQVVRQPEQSEEERRQLARIKRVIRRKTGGGVQQLAVEMRVGTLLLRGRCTSFYCKQVAQQAAMSFLPGQSIINEIEVDSRPR